MINIEVTLIYNVIELTAPDDATIYWILTHYCIPEHIRLLASIEGHIVSEDHVLKDGDKIRLYPMLGGG